MDVGISLSKVPVIGGAVSDAIDTFKKANDKLANTLPANFPKTDNGIVLFPLLPQFPGAGPPLPIFLGIKWPKTKPVKIATAAGLGLLSVATKGVPQLFGVASLAGFGYSELKKGRRVRSDRRMTWE